MPFEIFSDIEKTQLMKSVSTSTRDRKELGLLVNYLVNRLNYGIHGTKGWVDQLQSHAKAIQDEKTSDLLSQSLLRHMLTVKTLQQDPNGELAERFLPKKYEQFIEKHGENIGITKGNEQKEFSDPVNGKVSFFAVEKYEKSYQNFWDDYLYQIIISYIKELINRSEASRNNGLAKPIIFVFSRLKHLIKQGKLFSNRVSHFGTIEKELTEQAQIIHTRSDLPEVFSLNEEEVAFINLEKKFITERIKKIISLRKKFESNPLFVRYVHVPPEILVQFAQLLDYTISDLEEITKVGFFPKPILQSELEILQMLRAKRQEFAIVMVFQEELRTKYGHESFIQTLQSLLGNQDPEFLPVEFFYNFVEDKAIAIVSYDVSSDTEKLLTKKEVSSDAPKLLTKEERVLWKESCPFLMKAKKALSSAIGFREEISTETAVLPKFKFDTAPFCEMEILYLVQNDKACLISIPKFALPTVFKPKEIEMKFSAERGDFSQLFTKAKPFSQIKMDRLGAVNTSTEVFAFFVQQQKARIEFQQCLAQSKESLLLNKRRAAARYDYLPCIFSKNTKEFVPNADLADKYLLRVQNLIAQQKGLKYLFAEEYKLLKNILLKTKDLEEKQVFIAYQKALDEAHTDIKMLLEGFLAHWQNELDRFPILQGEAVEKFKDFVDTLRFS